MCYYFLYIYRRNNNIYIYNTIHIYFIQVEDIQNEVNQINITDTNDNISESIVSEYYSYNKQLHQAKVTLAQEVCKPTNILPFLNR